MTGEESAAVHLVTVLYRSEAGLPAFLASLQAQDIADWRLHVVDNASPDRSRELVAACADPRIGMTVNAVNLGFAKAANQGLRAAAAAGGAFFLVINNDTAFAPDFLRRLAGLRAALNADVITPRIMRSDRPDEGWYAGGSLDRGRIFINVHHRYDPQASRAPVPVDFASGCCLGLARRVVERIGLFDESFFVYWEDTDYCMRLNAHGIVMMYVPELTMLHAAGASSGGEFSDDYLRLYYRSYAQFLRKHFGGRRLATTLFWLWWRDKGRVRRYRALAIAVAAMIRGLRAPLLPEPALDPAASAMPSDTGPAVAPFRSRAQ